jgi:hypothetical protein
MPGGFAEIGQAGTHRSKEALALPRSARKFAVTIQYPKFKAAACHVAPVFLDSARTIDKALSWIEDRQSRVLHGVGESIAPH